MNIGARLRLIALAAGVGLMGLLIGLMTLGSQRRAGELHARLGRVDSESFRIAEEFKDSLRQLNNSLNEYGIKFDKAARDNFLEASHSLGLWIDEQKPRLATAREQDLMQQIETAYAAYLQSANDFFNLTRAHQKQSATMEDYTELRKKSQQLFDLGQSLAKAHFESRGALLAQANESITELRVLVLISLGCLFVLGIALAWVVYRDMIAPLQTRLVESQTLLERQEKLASLGMLAAGVAHEIRNPLTAIKAALFIQQKKFQPGTQEFADAKIVEREILRLERIVNDFLLFARPTEPHPALISAAVPLQEVHSLLAPQLAAAGKQLVLENSPNLKINADAAQIKQVLINLVQNASDAVGENGVVKLRARADHKRFGKSEKNVVILEVSDNGRGIPPEIQKRLFDPFFTTKDSGSGLGLSIAAGIVQKHGGAIQYQTQVDYGTTFGIILPQATE